MIKISHLAIDSTEWY